MRLQHLLGGVLTIQYTWACSGRHTHLPMLGSFRACSLQAICLPQSSNLEVIQPARLLLESNMPQQAYQGLNGWNVPVQDLDIFCGLLKPTCQVNFGS